MLEQHHMRAKLPEQQCLMGSQRPSCQDSDPPVPDFPPVAIRAVQDIDAPPGLQARHIRQFVPQPGRDQQPPGGHGPVAHLHHEAAALPAKGRDPACLHPAPVPGHLATSKPKNLSRRCAVPGQEVMHSGRRSIPLVPRVNDQHRAAGPGERDRAAQTSRASADYHHVKVLVHAPTLARNAAT